MPSDPAMNHFLPMAGFFFYHGNKLETLSKKLSDLHRTPVGSIFEPETIIVQSRGMERWLRFQLADHLGIAANLEFPFPNAFISGAFKALLGNPPFETHFARDPLTWRIYDALDDSRSLLKDAGLESILDDDDEHIKQYTFADILADLFDQYATFRPEWIESWEAGKSAVDGDGWQMAIYRNVSASCCSETRLAALRALEKSIQKPTLINHALPKRIALFGISSLPPYHLRIFLLLSKIMDVHFFILNPCLEHWFDIVAADTADKRSLFAQEDIVRLHLEEGHPLLAGLGAQGRDFLNVLHNQESIIDIPCFTENMGQGVLHYLQSRILHLSKDPFPFGTKDKTLKIHECHGKMREIQVLYDTLLAHINSDPTLEPRQILVMAPNIEEYTQAIHAVFGNPEQSSLAVPYRISDQSIAAGNAWLSACQMLLDIRESRFTASDILRLLSNSAIRRAFDLSEEDVPRLSEWFRRLNAAWGLDKNHKLTLNLPPDEANTFRWAADRLLLGYLMADDFNQPAFSLWPASFVEGDGAELAGNFSGFISALLSIYHELHGEKTAAEWALSFRRMIAQFALPETAEEQLIVFRHLDNLVQSVNLAQQTKPIPFGVIRKYLKDRLSKSLSSHGFLGAGITFCSMLPMRGIPFRVIALLGLDNSFPRQSHTVSFDLMGKRETRRPCDRSKEQDDRYIFLECILSARDALHLSYSLDLQDGVAKHMPSPVLGELKDYLSKAGDLPLDGLDSTICLKHRLQPFDPAYFSDTSDLPASFSEENAKLCRTLFSTTHELPQIESIPNGSHKKILEEISPDGFLEFFKNPSRYFVRHLLETSLPRQTETPMDHEPFEIDPRLAASIRRAFFTTDGNTHQDTLFNKALLSGTLPPQNAGLFEWNKLVSECKELSLQIDKFKKQDQTLNPVISLSVEQIKIVGSLSGVYSSGQFILLEPVRMTVWHKLKTWLTHLLINAEKGNTQTLLFCRQAAPLCFMPPPNAVDLLSKLLFWAKTSQEKPLPFFPEISYEYAKARFHNATHEKALEKATYVWNNENQYLPVSEQNEPHVRYLWSSVNPLQDRLFSECALSVFNPMLVELKKQKEEDA